jgi:hypothetical protein
LPGSARGYGGATPLPTTESGLIRIANEPSSSGRRPTRPVPTESAILPYPGQDGGQPPGSALFMRELDQRADSWVAHYLKVGDRLLERLRETEHAESYKGALKIMSNVAGAFLNRGQWAAALPIVQLLTSQRAQVVGWPEGQARALHDALAVVLPPQGAVPLARALTDATLPDRVAIHQLLALYGGLGAEAIIDVLMASRPNSSLGKELVGCIEALGVAAGPALLAAVREHSRKWNKVAPLLSLLGAVGYPGGEERILETLHHPQPQLRAAALVAAYKLLGHGAHRHLVEALADADADVKQRAVALLAASGSTDRQFTALLAQLIELDTPADAREEGLVITAVQGLRDLGNVNLTDRTSAEDALVAALKASWGGGLLGLGRKLGRTDGVQAAICDTLGVLGGERARQQLGQVPKDAVVAVKEAARAAGAAIERRHGAAA